LEPGGPLIGVGTLADLGFTRPFKILLSSSGSLTRNGTLRDIGSPPSHGAPTPAVKCKVEADLGPVRYLATPLGAGDQDVLRYFILVVALLLDPAAVLLLLAAASARK
jgi:hypothetical protein